MHPAVRQLLTDMAAAGMALMVFALFHHVLPREQQSLNVQIANPAAAAAAETVTVSGPDEDRTAAAGETQAAAAEDTQSAAAEKQAVRPEVRTATAYAGISDSGSRGGPGRGSTGMQKSRGGKDGMNGKGGSALTESGGSTEGAAAETDDTPLAEKFADKFTETVVQTDDSYSSPDLSVTVTEVSEGNLTYYVADIYVRDITCFRTALAEDTYGSGFRDSITDMAVLNNALLAVNGDYYGNTSEGVVIRNGVIYRANTTDCDICVLYYDGTMKVMPGSSFSVEEAVADGAWQAWTFGPALLDTDGNTISSFSSTSRIISANPRTAIGYYEPGHYCLVVVDGRGESAGITLPELSRLFYDLGCTAAYNLDGGNSSIMVWGDEIINNPSGGGRESSDALLIAEVNSYE